MKVQIHMRKWADTHTFYSWDENKEFPNFKIVEERKEALDVSNTHEALEWLQNNHPEFAIGASICAENGDFLLDASMDYYVSEYLTGRRFPNIPAKVLAEVVARAKNLSPV